MSFGRSVKWPTRQLAAFFAKAKIWLVGPQIWLVGSGRWTRRPFDTSAKRHSPDFLFQLQNGDVVAQIPSILARVRVDTVHGKVSLKRRKIPIEFRADQFAVCEFQVGHWTLWRTESIRINKFQSKQCPTVDYDDLDCFIGQQIGWQASVVAG